VTNYLLVMPVQRINKCVGLSQRDWSKTQSMSHLTSLSKVDHFM
jgi:hypothetical protein